MLTPNLLHYRVQKCFFKSGPSVGTVESDEKYLVWQRTCRCGLRNQQFVTTRTMTAEKIKDRNDSILL
jgi:hypothetical protein